MWLTLLGSAIWCFGFAGVGWAAGASWERVHNAFHYVEYLVLAARPRGGRRARVAPPETPPPAGRRACLTGIPCVQAGTLAPS